MKVTDAAVELGEAVVLRLRIGKDMPLAQALYTALEKAGLADRF